MALCVVTNKLFMLNVVAHYYIPWLARVFVTLALNLAQKCWIRGGVIRK